MLPFWQLAFFEAEIGKLSGEQLLAMKPVSNMLFDKCVSALDLDQGLPQNQFRTINALLVGSKFLAVIARLSISVTFSNVRCFVLFSSGQLEPDLVWFDSRHQPANCV
jgi:hypothetical protein